MSRKIRPVLTVAVAGLAIGPALVAAPAQARPPQIILTGANEVTVAGVPNQGDPDGSGTFTFKVKPARGTLCYTLTATGISPATAAHIHVAPPTTNGPVVIPLLPPTEGSSTGCASADPALLSEIKRNPEQYYVNVHNADYPAGALRGQLF